MIFLAPFSGAGDFGPVRARFSPSSNAAIHRTTKCLTEDSDPRILLELSRERRRFPVRKEINRRAPLKVHQNRAVTLSFVLRPVIDSDDFGSVGRWQLNLANPLNNCVGAYASKRKENDTVDKEPVSTWSLR